MFRSSDFHKNLHKLKTSKKLDVMHITRESCTEESTFYLVNSGVRFFKGDLLFQPPYNAESFGCEEIKVDSSILKELDFDENGMCEIEIRLKDDSMYQIQINDPDMRLDLTHKLPGKAVLELVNKSWPMIKTEGEYQSAMERLLALTDHDLPPGSDEEAEFELLTLLIENYEQKIVSPVDVDPIEAILFSNKDAYQRYPDWPKNTLYYTTGAKIRYAYDSAGMDVAANQYYTIEPGKSALISTGLCVQPEFKLPEPFSLAMQVWPRSGLSVRQNIETGAGLIDPDYRGEIMIHLYNHGTEPLEINSGDYIAQIVFCAVIAPSKITFQEVTNLDKTSRNSKGFGSSGK